MPRPLPDPVALAQALIRCPSVTPADAGALDVLQDALSALGFSCTRLPFESGGPRIDNLFARFGAGRPHFAYAGHTDVVPPGPREAWGSDPFAGLIRDGHLIGRGAADMKGGIAAFVAAAATFLAARPDFSGSISLVITGDEEGPATDGTVRMLDWMAAHGHIPDACLVGEPTSAAELGDMVKVGRRGSLNGTITVTGQQGHVAYPHLAANPIPRMAEIVRRLSAWRIDSGNAHFQPSNLEFTSVDVGNPATNVIPGAAAARFNIRFNDIAPGEALIAHVREVCDAVAAEMGGQATLQAAISGRAFLTQPGPFTDAIAAAVADVTGRRPELSTTGGTSDARFIAAHCPVAEFGLVGQTMHKADERTPVADIAALARIYVRLLERFFA